MASHLCISVRFLQPYSHGRNENGNPEWPPSPLRVMQALVAASAGRWNERSMLRHAAEAIHWLESLAPPRIIAAQAIPSDRPYRLYVPDNVTDKVAASWSKGREASIADYRTEKDVLPVSLEGDAVHYLYPLTDSSTAWRDSINILTTAARAITHLGWGIDMAAGDVSVINDEQAARLAGQRWHPSPIGGTPLRAPKPGTLDDLIRKHKDLLARITADGLRPVPPLRVFEVVRYRCQDQPVQRPCRVFELRNDDGSRFRYPPQRLIHIAGMVRYRTIRAMASKQLLERLYPNHDQTKDPFRDGSPSLGIKNPDLWVETYIAGHNNEEGEEHCQLSYLPLPSVGHPHTDPGVRRVMIAAPVGDDAWLDHIARRLASQVLKPEPGKPDPFAGREPPLLVPVPQGLYRKGVLACYTDQSSVWHSFTPVILPGHDDQKADKTRKLIEKALAQSGIEQPCDFEWSAFSRFPKSFSAHKYDKEKRPQGYIRPSYLNSQTAVHLTLRFHDGSDKKNPVAVPGPIVIGAGRHCGLGLFAAVKSS